MFERSEHSFSRRDFLVSSAAAAIAAALPWVDSSSATAAFDPLKSGTQPLTGASRISMGGTFGKMYKSGLERMGKVPFEVNFVLADVNFNMKRMFTNFSGDISGRFIEVCSSYSEDGESFPPILQEVVEKIVQYQKPDGHFGADVNWQDKMDTFNETDNAKMMPILWGNGRLLLGLVAAWKAFGKAETLAAVQKLGDFYVNTVEPRFCDPTHLEEYKFEAPGYASAYVTCVYEGMEGLVQLYRATKDKRYLDCACKMADFHEQFDVLPVRHSHGSLSEHNALVLIYEETGDRKYLDRVTKRWTDAVEGGYINVCGSVLEKFWVTGYNRDEGCTEADWLRLNLMLWRNTKDDKYLDMAERLLYNGYIANQWPSGGFGHRYMGIDEKGPFSYQKYSQESVWCCSFHCPMGLYDFKRYLAVGFDGQNGKPGTIRYNFGKIFVSPILVNGQTWTVKSGMAKNGLFAVTLDGPANAEVFFDYRKPNWANEVQVCLAGQSEPVDLSKPLKAGAKLEIAYLYDDVRLEDRRLNPVAIPAGAANLKEVALFNAAKALVAKTGGGEKIEDLTATVVDGKLSVDRSALTTLKDLYYAPEEERGAGHSFLFNLDVKR